MATFKIVWCEVIKSGEKNGKPWTMTKMSLETPAGVITENVTTFDTVQNGTNIEGEIVQNGQYLNFVKAKAVAGQNFKTAQIEKTMERKEQSIGKFQDSKEYAIKLASSMTNAINLAIAQQTPNPEAILKWRKWILDSWDIDPTDLNAF